MEYVYENVYDDHDINAIVFIQAHIRSYLWRKRIREKIFLLEDNDLKTLSISISENSIDIDCNNELTIVSQDDNIFMHSGNSSPRKIFVSQSKSKPPLVSFSGSNQPNDTCLTEENVYVEQKVEIPTIKDMLNVRKQLLSKQTAIHNSLKTTRKPFKDLVSYIQARQAEFDAEFLQKLSSVSISDFFVSPPISTLVSFSNNNSKNYDTSRLPSLNKSHDAIRDNHFESTYTCLKGYLPPTTDSRTIDKKKFAQSVRILKNDIKEEAERLKIQSKQLSLQGDAFADATALTVLNQLSTFGRHGGIDSVREDHADGSWQVSLFPGHPQHPILNADMKANGFSDRSQPPFPISVLHTSVLCVLPREQVNGMHVDHAHIPLSANKNLENSKKLLAVQVAPSDVLPPLLPSPATPPPVIKNLPMYTRHVTQPLAEEPNILSTILLARQVVPVLPLSGSSRRPQTAATSTTDLSSANVPEEGPAANLVANEDWSNFVGMYSPTKASARARAVLACTGDRPGFLWEKVLVGDFIADNEMHTAFEKQESVKQEKNKQNVMREKVINQKVKQAHASAELQIHLSMKRRIIQKRSLDEKRTCEKLIEKENRSQMRTKQILKAVADAPRMMQHPLIPRIPLRNVNSNESASLTSASTKSSTSEDFSISNPNQSTSLNMENTFRKEATQLDHSSRSLNKEINYKVTPRTTLKQIKTQQQNFQNSFIRKLNVMEKGGRIHHAHQIRNEAQIENQHSARIIKEMEQASATAVADWKSWECIKKQIEGRHSNELMHKAMITIAEDEATRIVKLLKNKQDLKEEKRILSELKEYLQVELEVSTMPISQPKIPFKRNGVNVIRHTHGHRKLSTSADVVQGVPVR